MKLILIIFWIRQQLDLDKPISLFYFESASVNFVRKSRNVASSSDFSQNQGYYKYWQEEFTFWNHPFVGAIIRCCGCSQANGRLKFSTPSGMYKIICRTVNSQFNWFNVENFRNSIKAQCKIETFSNNVSSRRFLRQSDYWCNGT